MDSIPEEEGTVVMLSEKVAAARAAFGNEFPGQGESGGGATGSRWGQ
jgi:hypothetical protein